MTSQHRPQKQQKSLVTPLVSQVSTSTSNSVPSVALEEIRSSSGVPNFVQSTTPTTTIHPAVTNHTTNFSGTPCITVQPVTIGTHTVSPVLSLVQASNGQVYLIQQQQQSTTTHHSASAAAAAVGGNELFHHSPMTILATDNLSSPRCDIITKKSKHKAINYYFEICTSIFLW